eukprot:6176740-Pleurochrysis_carterae.AAC.2
MERRAFSARTRGRQLRLTTESPHGRANSSKFTPSGNSGQPYKCSVRFLDSLSHVLSAFCLRKKDYGISHDVLGREDPGAQKLCVPGPLPLPPTHAVAVGPAVRRYEDHTLWCLLARHVPAVTGAPSMRFIGHSSRSPPPP